MMLRKSLLIFLLLESLCSYAQKEDLLDAEPRYGFIENKGQVLDQDFMPNPDVKFVLPLANNNVVLKATGFSYDTYITEQNISKKKSSDSLPSYTPDKSQLDISFKFHRVDVEFIGSNPSAEIITYERSKDFVTFYSSEDGKQIKVHYYERLIYKNIYPGIDLEFVARPGKEKPVEYNFIVSPGADISQIQLGYNGANEGVLKDGKLEFKLAHGKLTESIPSSYWKESRKVASINYRKIPNGNNQLTLGFSREGKNKDETLVIDPTPNLDWGSYYGGTDFDIAYKIHTDAVGNLYVVGYSVSLNAIATSGTHQITFAGVTDAFLVKFNSSGVRQWSTYYGGIEYDIAYSVTTDAAGNIYTAGGTKSSTSIATPGSFQSQIGSIGDNWDAFIVKFNPSGVRQWGTYIGAVESEEGTSIAADTNGNVYIGGLTSGNSSTIATSGAHQTAFGGGSSDAFLMKFNSAGARLWGTFYGGGSYESGGMNISIDNSNNVYLAGASQSPNMISTAGSHQAALVGTVNAYIVKFNSNGVRQWGTYYGGGYEANWGIVSDATGNVYATGVTASTSGIATPGGHQQFFGGVQDGYIVKFNTNGVRQWGTYYGGSQSEFFKMIAIDGSSNLYAIGLTSSLTSIATPGSHQSVLSGPGDAFIVKFDANGIRQWGTYYGGPSYEDGTAISVSSSGLVYVTGYTESTSMISTGGSHQSVFGGGSADAFIARFSTSGSCTAAETNGLAIQTSSYICAVKFTTNKLPNCIATYAWDFGDGGTSLDRNPMHVYGSAGTYNVSVLITYNCPLCQSQTTLTKQVIYNPPTNILEDRVISIVTDQRPQVVATSASSFSEAWPLNQSNNALDIKGSYLNGSQGVWRNDASYVYKKDRMFSSAIDVSKDGTFTLEQFNWRYGELNAVPNWVKANSMTKYSPYSFELENKDVLGVYSAAIYDYGGQLPVANGVNMRNDEMAFTSFEFLEGSVGGNWILGSQSVPAYSTYAILSASKNMAVVEATLLQLENVVAVDIISKSSQLLPVPNYQIYYQGNEIICMRVHPENPLWSIVVLKTAPVEDYWTGVLRIKNIVIPTVVSVRDLIIAHTGKQSLKITSNQTFKQDLLRLDAGKSYWVNSWVSVNNPSITTPVLGTNLGIDIIAKQKNGQVISTFSFAPSGTVIEGWQQLKGSFICPANTAYIEILFKPGSTGTAWYDDLRLHPENGNMKGYVYNLSDYRLQAVLDEENFASYFYYDREGNLHLTKKETTDGIKTLSENISYQVER